jgi:hypothetical protein
LDLSDFSFNRSKEILKDYKGSLSDTVIEERKFLPMFQGGPGGQFLQKAPPLAAGGSR